MEHARTQCCIHHACMYLYPCASGYPVERIADAGPPHTRAHVLRSVRARVFAIGRPRIRAGTCERVPSAWTAGGSARRRSGRRRRSTRTSACGTLRVSPRCIMYAPPFRPGGAPPQAGRARRVVDAARAVVRGGTADARARVYAQTCGHAHARVFPCVGKAARSKDGISVCMDMYIGMHHTYMHI
jgi:hypothetical protein